MVINVPKKTFSCIHLMIVIYETKVVKKKLRLQGKNIINLQWRAENDICIQWICK